MNEMKLLIMETLDNDYNKNYKKKRNVLTTESNMEIDKDAFRASYESTFMIWRNSFVNEGTSKNGSNVSPETEQYSDNMERHQSI